MVGSTAGPGDFCIANIYYNIVKNDAMEDAEKKELVTKCFGEHAKVLAMVCGLCDNKCFAEYIACRPQRKF